MDITKIAQNLIEDIAAIFSQNLAEKSLEQQLQEIDLDKKEEIAEEHIEQRIHGMNWKSKALKKLKKNESCLPTGNLLAEWFVKYLHKLLCSSPKSEQPLSFKIIHKLPHYPPSECVIQVLKDEKPLTDLQVGNGIFSDYVANRRLSASNIHKIFQLLLELEDVATLQEYVPLIQRDVTLKKQNKTRYCAKYNMGTPGNIKDILTPHLDVVIVVSTEKSSSLNLRFDVGSIKMLISKMDDFQRSTAVIKDVCNSSVCFQFDEPIDLKESKTKYDLIFFSMRLPIRYQHRALDLLATNIQMRDYLFPKYNCRKELPCSTTNLDLLNSEIAENPEQLQAVRHISSGPNPYAPYIIFGPPGTGKTTTIVESILQLRLQRPESRILVTAGSNSACDTIALRICQYFKSSLRLREHLSNTDALPMIRIFSKSIQKRGVENIPDILLKRSNVAWKCGRHAYPAVEDILKYGIVVVTLCTVGKLVCGDVNVGNYFTHIFIDEAAASTEPETLVGIMGIKKDSNENCRVILSGDHKQLGPVLKSGGAIKLGLDLSLMQRLLNSECYALDGNGNYDHTLQTRLRRNYRSHAEIVTLYNTLYYNNELLANKTEDDTKPHRNWSFLPKSSYPIIFQAVHGETIKEDSTSSCNMLEIEVLMWYIKRLIEVDCVDQTDIGIIAPYKLQCQHIQKRLNEQALKVEVGSVENFQGREKEIIIASMVRSFANLGFLQNPRRLNVLLSRAKSLLIIMGNPVSLRHFKDMNFVIEECKKNGTYLRKEKSGRSSKSNSNNKLHLIIDCESS